MEFEIFYCDLSSTLLFQGTKVTQKLCEKRGDLFSCSENESLAHCISADARMGKGIAVIFKKKFGGVDDIKSQGNLRGASIDLFPCFVFI